MVSYLIKNKNYLLTFLSFFLAAVISHYYYPHEDASILFSYSENLVETGVISYFPGGEAAEGATDFLWMLLLSFFYYFGFDIYFSAILINLFSLIIIIKHLKNKFNLSNLVSLSVLILHLFLTHTYAAIGGFSVLFVEMILVFMITNFIEKNNLSVIFFSFVGCLTRPDFILFALPVNLILLIQNFKLRIIIAYLIYTILGASYFFWRYKYFQELMPLPFYVKNTWDFFNNKEWLRQIIIFSPMILAISHLKLKKNLNLNLITMLLVAVIPTLYYMNQTLYQNVAQRFYFYLPTIFLIIFLQFKYTLQMNKKNLFFHKIIISICLFSSVLNFATNQNPLNFLKKKTENFYLLTKDLYDINRSSNISIATTEAGLINYISKAKTTDLFGLNTRLLAKKPADRQYIQNNFYDIIFINSSIVGENCSSLEKAFKVASELVNTEGSRKDTWSEFSYKILAGVDKKKYHSFILEYPASAFVNVKSKSYPLLKQSLINRGALFCK